MIFEGLGVQKTPCCLRLWRTLYPLRARRHRSVWVAVLCASCCSRPLGVAGWTSCHRWRDSWRWAPSAVPSSSPRCRYGRSQAARPSYIHLQITVIRNILICRNGQAVSGKAPFGWSKFSWMNFNLDFLRVITFLYSPLNNINHKYHISG